MLRYLRERQGERSGADADVPERTAEEEDTVKYRRQVWHTAEVGRPAALRG
jgi:hypothetical protein